MTTSQASVGMSASPRAGHCDYRLATRAVRQHVYELNRGQSDRVDRERCTGEHETVAEATSVVTPCAGRERRAATAARVLIVDDDLALLRALPEALRLRFSGLEVDTTSSAAAALDQIAVWDYDAIVTDIKMPGMDGLTLLSEIRARRPETPTLLITGHGEQALAIDALRGGAFDYVQKPIDREYFVASLRRAIQTGELRRRAKEHDRALERRTDQLERIVEERTRELHQIHSVLESPLKWLIGPSDQLENVVQQIKRVADSPLTVVIEGETGTGKELAARAIHHLSARRSKPFVAVDCGAIPDSLIESELFGHEKGAFTGAHQRREGRFQTASSGTLFLDEIANVPLATQSKLLRVLQERQLQPLGSKRLIRLEARIIAASNVALDREVQAGRLRQDLYYRLNEFVITLPPLRARDDILHLAKDFVAEASMEFGCPCGEISGAAAQVLQHYGWPGNVRELRSVIRRAVLLAPDAIEPEHLSCFDAGVSPTTAETTHSIGVRPALGNAVPVGPSLRTIAETAAADAEQQAIRRVLRLTNGNKSEAARLLRTDYKTLHVKMKRYGISAAQIRDIGMARP